MKKIYYHQSLDEFDKTKKSAIDPATIEWNETALNQLLTWSKIPNFYTNIYRDTIPKAIANQRNFTIMTYPDGQLDLKGYLHLLENILIIEDTKNIAKSDIKSFIVEAIRTAHIVKKARELGLEKDLFTPNTENAVLRDNIAHLYDQAMVELQLPQPTEAKLKAFYKEHRSTIFYQLAKVNIYALIYSDKEKAENIWQQYKNGIPFKELTHRRLVKTFIRDRQGHIRPLLRHKTKSYLGEAAFQLKEGEVQGIIEYTHDKKGPQYALIKCIKKRPAKQLTYSDVEDTIVQTFKDYHRKNLEEEILQNLKQKYNLVINEEVLAKTISPPAK